MNIFQVQRRGVGEGPYHPPGPWCTEHRAADLAGAHEYVAKHPKDWTEMRVHVDPREADEALRRAIEDLP